MFTSYRGDLALRDADRSRQLIKSPWYQQNWGEGYEIKEGRDGDDAIFKTAFSPAEFDLIRSQDSKGRFGNSKGGYRYSTSIAGIMGEGGDFVVLDDPHNVEQAESADVRKDTIRRLDLALPTRVRSPTGGIVIIMQRLHEKDYSGHVLENEPGEWQHICLPAEYEVNPETGENAHPTPTRTCLINEETGEPWEDWRTEPGELLFPALFSGGRIDKLKKPLGVYGVSGQLQQRPTPRSGGMFDREDLERNVVEEKNMPTIVKWCRAWDLASTKDGGDYTAHVKAGKGSDGLIYFVFAAELQEKSSTVRKMFDRFVKVDGASVITRLPQDPGQAGKDQAEQYVAGNLGYPIKVVRPTGDKETRAEPLSSAFQIDMVKIVAGTWNDTLIERLASFPAPGAPDDVVDAAADAYNELTLGHNFASGQKIMNG
jgi:predicted phage terminase large subunit-like protein